MSLQALSDHTVFSKYSRYLHSKKRRETWSEMIDRVFDMHEIKYSEALKNPEFREEFEFAKDMAKKKRVLGSQRLLQFGGEAIFKNPAKLYNCSYSYVDRPAAFNEAMYLLLCGTGVGFSVQYKHVAKLPDIAKPTLGTKTFKPEDSIEGWADCIAAVMSSYLSDGGVMPSMKGYDVEFDMSGIRPEGSMIANQFKAPGPKSLINSLKKIKEVIEARLSLGENRLHPIDACDIILHFSDAVLSGGVRRSACLCLFSKDDKEMLTAKTGDWFIKNPQRGRSNNSALLVRNQVTEEEFAEIIKSTRAFGEPGFIFADNEDIGFNPCAEVAMYPQTIDARSGFQFCVSGETKLISRNGLYKIKDVIGTPVEIWNGKAWKTVTPYQTGNNDDLYRVTFSDGSYLDATKNHKFLVKNRFEKEYRELETVDIINELKNSKYVISVPRSNFLDFDFGTEEKNAYEYGFVLGDGHIDKNKVKANLYSMDKNLKFEDADKYKKIYYNHNRTSYETIVFNLDLERSKELKLSQDLPEWVTKMSKRSILLFLAGWADSDGSHSSKGIRVYGLEKRLSTMQLLLSKCGINSSLNLSQKMGTKTNLGERKNDLWYLQITKTYEIPCQRLVCNNKTDASFKGKDQVIKSVIKISSGNNSYCLTEDDLHQCVFNNVLTKQCNLTEGNGKYCDTKLKFFDVCRASATIGTMQAGYTNFKYLAKETQEITEREALLGCSITGVMDNPDILLNAEIQREGAEIVKAINKKVAKLIDINSAARCNVIKPAGSTSCVLSTSSGIHPHHARRYIRRVQGNRNEFAMQHFKKINPLAVETSVWSTNGTDEVISFLCEVPKGAIVKNNIGAVQLLEKVKLTQQNWIEYGTNEELCAIKGIRHNVSNTITVKDEEWDEVRDYIYENRHYFAGISLLSASGDLDYPQAPFTSVLNEKELVEEYGYGAIMASGLIVDGLAIFNNNLWAACDCLNGIGETLQTIEEPSEPVKPVRKSFKTEKEFSSALVNYAIELSIYYNTKSIYELNAKKQDWVRRASQFSTRYFEGNTRKMTHCLKHVFSFKQWIDLSREYKEIDWSLAIEEVETIVSADTLAGQACSGGQCELR